MFEKGQIVSRLDRPDGEVIQEVEIFAIPDGDGKYLVKTQGGAVNLVPEDCLSPVSK